MHRSGRNDFSHDFSHVSKPMVVAWVLETTTVAYHVICHACYATLVGISWENIEYCMVVRLWFLDVLRPELAIF